MRLFKLLLAIFFVCTTYGQVTVNTSNLKVNGVSITNNTINFNGNETINVSLDVNLTTLNGNSSNIFGNLFLYFKPVNSENEVQVGFTSVTFIVSYPPFVTQTTYTSVNSFASIVLSRSNFFATGGTFYAKYINNSNSSYLSPNILVSGGSRTSTIPNPTQTNAICCNQTIRYGDKPSLITGSTLNDSGLNVSWVKGANIATLNYATNSSNNNFVSDYLFETTTFRRQITSSTNLSTNSNSLVITVVPTPIISNTISADASMMDDGSYEVGVNDPIEFSGFNSKVNLNVLSNPFHTVVRSDPFVNVDYYQWQYKSGWSDGKWTDIPNATLSSLSGFSLSMVPNNTFQNSFFVRRIAKYQSISHVSNFLKIITRKSSISNTICCNQLLASNQAGFQAPSTIVGSTPVFSVFEALGTSTPANAPFNISNPLYQWQKRSRSGSWSNIIGANAKDYLPPSITTFNTSINYRRIVRFNYRILDHYFNSTPVYSDKFYDTYSSFVIIKTSGGRTARFSDSDEAVNDSLNFIIYPNPASNDLYVSNNSSFAEINLKVFNALGQEIKLDYLNIDKNIISIDISSLQKGIYYMSFGNNSNIIKKFIKE